MGNPYCEERYDTYKEPREYTDLIARERERDICQTNKPRLESNVEDC